ncbi:hypothetical protein [Paenibacillus polymyxa]|uniref:hypothetical protein n=1 Tax=Paenibacillus polymyxa TaxID=1406 RepID=UPI002AB53E61|nr:hypothetical protein [Paenibacillus polymyxa]MDY8021278.1 hypothetical protein [Paenibacillus polymyxa]
MNEHQLGNVYKGHFEYQDKPGTKDFRRMVLIDITGEDEDIGVLTQITSQEPKDPPTWHDQYRKPINKWKESGLTKMSYARVNKNFPLPLNVLNRPIGQMNEEEFLRIAEAALLYMSVHGFKH